MRTRGLLTLSAAVLMGLTACSGSSADATASRTASPSSDGELTGTLTVFAAASLTGVFTELGDELEADDPDLDIRFNFAGSSALATQIAQGAPADVFASANEEQMKVVTDAGLQGEDPTIFTENVLEIAVPKGNPARIMGLADFARPHPVLALCAPDVPCGAAATKVF